MPIRTTAALAASSVLRCYRNRNPRNLERLGIIPQRDGYELNDDRDRLKFTYQVRLEKQDRHLVGNVIHCEDGGVISASTKEWPIAKNLYRLTDAAAAQNLGRILARRCLRSGIQFVSHGYSPADMEKSNLLRNFHEALAEGGLVTEEPRPAEHLQLWEYPEVDYNLDVEDDVAELLAEQSSSEDGEAMVKTKKKKKKKAVVSENEESSEYQHDDES